MRVVWALPQRIRLRIVSLRSFRCLTADFYSSIRISAYSCITDATIFDRMWFTKKGKHGLLYLVLCSGCYGACMCGRHSHFYTTLKPLYITLALNKGSSLPVKLRVCQNISDVGKQ